MTPQELKASILQLAIQGKLVEQRPEEGTGEELYKQIQAEKQKLIKAGKIKKEKPLPEITEDEIPFDIPESWKWVRVAQIVTFNPKNDIDNNIDTSFVPMSCVSDGFRNTHTFEVKKWGAIKKGFTHFANGDIGIAKITPCFQNRKSVVFRDLINGYGAGTTELSIVRVINNTVLREYLLWFFKTEYFIANGVKSFTGTAGQQRIHKDYLATSLLPLPPLAEQKRIVAKIEELLPYIDRYEKAWNRLEDLNKRFPADMQKSILQMAIQGKLVEQRPEEGTAEELYKQIQAEKQKLIKAGKIKKEKPLPEITEDEIPFDIPESWKWVRVAQIVTFNPKNDIDNNIDTSFVPMSCVSDGFRNTHTFEVKKWGAIKKGFTHFANGDIGIAKITPCFQNRKSVVFRDLINGYGAGTTELSIVRVINNTVLREYLLWFFKTEYFIANGVKSFTGTAGQQRIHKDYLATSLLPLPHLAEQKRIVAKLEEILPLCEKLKQC